MAIPGVDYSESCSPVATDCSVRLVLVLSLYFIGQEKELTGVNDNWTVELYDVEVAFLTTEPGTKTYITIPDGVVALGMMTPKLAKEHAYELTVSMYGNIDTAFEILSEIQRNPKRYVRVKLTLAYSTNTTKIVSYLLC
jgi:hypothetical protein